MHIPLFEQFLELRQHMPHIGLGDYPTPIRKLEALGARIGAPQLYLKDDGQSGEPFGGNKVRKLEFLLANALEKGAKGVVTVGQAGSNHTLTTIVWAKKMGLNSYAFLSPQLNAEYLRRNLLLSKHFGGDIRYFSSDEMRDKAVEDFVQAHGVEYYIPIGGACSLGCAGFVNGVFELKQQIEAGIMPEPDYIYVTMGSTGTAAGIILGVALAGLKTKVVPVRISGDAAGKKKTLIDALNRTSTFLHERDVACPLIRFAPTDVTIRDGFFGREYARITPQDAEAIQALYDAEGIKLDGTYTGKTFAAMLHDLVQDHVRDKVVLFWNTYCSGEFADTVKNVDYKTLPEGLHCYFEGEIQTLDQGA